MEIPIACHLDRTAARAQLQEWRDLLAGAVASTDRISATELSLRLRDDLAQLDAVVRLAQREKACCPFFGFVIRIEPEEVSLRVTVPEEAASLLSEFAAFGGSPSHEAARSLGRR